MVRELTSFEKLTTDFDEVEVLAWRLDSRGNNDRVEIALLWARAAPVGRAPSWALVQGYRHPDEDNSWRRSVHFREPRSPITHPRPGEDPDGTWHAYQRYDHAPTIREICDFAAVDFLAADLPDAYRRVSAELRKAAWRRVAGDEPRCVFGK